MVEVLRYCASAADSMRQKKGSSSSTVIGEQYLRHDNHHQRAWFASLLVVAPVWDASSEAPLPLH